MRAKTLREREAYSPKLDLIIESRNNRESSCAIYYWSELLKLIMLTKRKHLLKVYTAWSIAIRYTLC